jgi:hypothetical protein
MIFFSGFYSILLHFYMLYHTSDEIRIVYEASMAIQSVSTSLSQTIVSLNDSFLLDYQAREALLNAQPANIQRALELQASIIARAILDHQSPLRFMLPENVICGFDEYGEPLLVAVPIHQREQKVGGLLDHLKAADFNLYLKRLEDSPDEAISTCGRLLRHTIARYLVYRLLPLPEQIDQNQRPFSGYALEFFMPQWIALDDQDNLLVNSVEEAWASIASMQHYLSILNVAARLAPYFIHDEEYQQKRYGMLAQLINQGHALARHETGGIIARLKQRVAGNSLNRGFDLDLPFFDDQALEIRTLNIPVVPHGRIQFVPAFLVIALRVKQMEVEHSPGLSHTTRAHLLGELKALEDAFD